MAFPGIPRKGEPGYISEDENVDSPEVSTKSKVEKWNIVDPLARLFPRITPILDTRSLMKGNACLLMMIPPDSNWNGIQGGCRGIRSKDEGFDRKRILMSKRSSSDRPRARFPGLREMTQLS